MAYQAVGRTDVGLVRKENQDNFLILQNQAVYAVADGMGGHAGGREASAITVEVLRQKLGEVQSPDQAAAERALSAANDRILAEAGARGLAGMGTTLVLAFPDREQWKILHIGDSRAYLIRPDEIRILTRDHSLVRELLSRGSITPEEARVHPHKNVLTRALGVQAGPEPEWSQAPARAGEYLLLCSDGLYNMVEEGKMLDIVLRPELSLAAKVDSLIEEAKARGGLDNITAILVTEEAGPS